MASWRVLEAAGYGDESAAILSSAATVSLSLSLISLASRVDRTVVGCGIARRVQRVAGSTEEGIGGSGLP